jgi:mRNA-degrading endonuclease RelE of RelBE toxin-antitoxin system
LWQIDESEDVVKQFKKLGSFEKTKYREIVRQLASDEHPRRFGEFVPTKKHGKCWTTRLTKSCRLAYRVYEDIKTIQLVYVGDHKEVYGKDKHS